MGSEKGIIKKLKLHELVGYSYENNMDVYPITCTAAVYDENNKSLAEILKNLGSGGSSGGSGDTPTIKTKFLRIYKSSTVQPATPDGGSYSFTDNSLTVPTEWNGSSEGLDNPIWMSMGSILSNTDDIVWSTPICVSGSVTDRVLRRCYVAMVYKNSETQPDTPVGGSCDFSNNTPIFTPPDGWSTNSDVAVNENTWCSIRAFYSDNTETQWSVPSKTAQASITLTAAQLEEIAGYIKITTNMLEYLVQKMTLNTDELEVVAKNVKMTTDNLNTIANNILESSNFYKNVASKIEFSAEDYKLIADNITLQDEQLDVISTKIQTNAQFISTVAKQITFSADDLNTIAKNVQLSAEQLQVIAGNVKITLTDDEMQAIADKVTLSSENKEAIIVDLLGTLNTKDLTVNGGASQFNADGSGYVANQNIKWDKDGNSTFNGTFTTGTGDKTITITNDNAGNGELNLGDLVDISYATTGYYVQGSLIGNGESGKIIVKSMHPIDKAISSDPNEQSTTIKEYQTTTITGSSIDVNQLEAKYVNASSIYSEFISGGFYRMYSILNKGNNTFKSNTDGTSGLTLDGEKVFGDQIFIISDDTDGKVITLPAIYGNSAFCLTFIRQSSHSVTFSGNFVTSSGETTSFTPTSRVITFYHVLSMTYWFVDD